MLDKKKFCKLMFGLGEMYNTQITEFVMEMYFETVKEYDYKQIEAAVMKVIKTNKYNSLPKPAELIEWLEGNPEDKAVIAWTIAHKALKEHGYYKSVEFEDPLISHVIEELGGWMAFCDTLHENIPFVEKRFITFYRSLAKRGVMMGKKLIGFVELKNGEKGYTDHIPGTVRVGIDNQGREIIKKGG